MRKTPFCKENEMSVNTDCRKECVVCGKTCHRNGTHEEHRCFLHRRKGNKFLTAYFVAATLKVADDRIKEEERKLADRIRKSPTGG